MKGRFFKIMSVLTLILTISLSAMGQTSNEQSKDNALQTQTMKLKVSGITCGGDLKDIAGAVSKIEGVTSCKALGKASATSVFEVTFNPAVVTEKDIRSKVEDVPGCSNPNDRPYKVKQAELIKL